MNIRIYPIALGNTRCYVVQAEKTLMVDAGAPKQGQRFAQALEKLSIDPKMIQLIVLTHGHWDHSGSVREIQAMTGARIALHYRERVGLEHAATYPPPVPPGATAWGRILVRLATPFVRCVRFPAAEVDVVLDDTEMSLSAYGIPGKILPTPGHSPGSVSVVLETGAAFVGDLAMNQFPLTVRPGLPIFAEDLHQVKQGWRRLLREGATMVYPGHGKPFPADIMRQCVE